MTTSLTVGMLSPGPAPFRREETYLNPSTRKSSSSVRRYEYTYDLPSAVIKIGPIRSTPAGSGGVSSFQSARSPVATSSRYTLV